VYGRASGLHSRDVEYSIWCWYEHASAENSVTVPVLHNRKISQLIVYDTIPARQWKAKKTVWKARQAQKIVLYGCCECHVCTCLPGCRDCASMHMRASPQHDASTPRLHGQSITHNGATTTSVWDMPFTTAVSAAETKRLPAQLMGCEDCWFPQRTWGAERERGMVSASVPHIASTVRTSTVST